MNEPAKTPNQKKFEEATNKSSFSPVGDPRDKANEKATAKEGHEKTEVPSKVNKEVWAQAEHSVLNKSGLHGVNAEGRKAQIQAEYDQMIENDKRTKEWAGDGAILGDTK